MDILIVEDHRDSIDLMIAHLQKEGHILRFAKNGLEALGEIEKGKPDLILLDMEMPIIDGLDTCGILKNYEYSKNIPIIGVSSNSQESEIDEALKSGCDEYITKPINIRKLNLVLEKLRTS